MIARRRAVLGLSFTYAVSRELGGDVLGRTGRRIAACWRLATASTTPTADFVIITATVACSYHESIPTAVVSRGITAAARSCADNVAVNRRNVVPAARRVVIVVVGVDIVLALILR